MRRPVTPHLLLLSFLVLGAALLLAVPARADEEAGPDLATVDGVKTALADKDPAVRLETIRLTIGSCGFRVTLTDRKKVSLQDVARRGSRCELDRLLRMESSHRSTSSPARS